MANINGLTGTAADVTSSNELKVTLPTDAAATNASSVRIFSENDPGTVTGTADVKSPETSHDYRLRVGADVFLDSETFCYTAQNTGKHRCDIVTMTPSLTASPGFLSTNGAGITTTTTGVRITTHRFFPLFGQQTSLYVECSAAFSATLASATNTTIDFGAMQMSTTNPYTPSDGVYFRATSAGVRGVINFNGVETTTALFSSFTPAIGQVYQFLISIDERSVEFWIDDVLYAEIATQAGNGQPQMSVSCPWGVRHVIAGGAAGAAMSFKVSDMSVMLGDIGGAKAWGHMLAGLGQCAYQGQSGGTMGTTANYANSANPASAAGSNTAANVQGLGGQFAINAAATAVTDFIATSYTVPAGSTTSGGRTFYCTGAKISCANLGAAVATTPTTLAWSIAFGHTADSLATAETASFANATTKAPRRIAMGVMTVPVGAAVGALYDRDLTMRFDGCPIPVCPGERIASVMKFLVGTATPSQSVYGHVTFDGYFA